MTILPIVEGRATAQAATVRKRQALLVLLALTSVAVIVALDVGTSLAWLAVAAMVLAVGTYLAILHRGRLIETERSFRLLRDGDDLTMGALGTPDYVANADPPAFPAVNYPAANPPDLWALVRFGAAYLAGWALAPVVFVLTLLAGETPRDTTSQRWLANLQAAQVRLRDQSLRTLAVSAAATASVTGAGTVAMLGGAGAAGATTITASASFTAGPSVSASPAAVSRYVVVQGDTVWAIANRFGTTTAAIASANRMTNPNLIYPGQDLVIPDRVTDSTGGVRPLIGADRDIHRTERRHPRRYCRTVWDNGLGAGQHQQHPQPEPDPARPGSRCPRPRQPGPGPSHHPAGVPARSFPSDVHIAADYRSCRADPTDPPATSSRAEIAVQTVLAQVGKPYVWAGAGPNVFDCSGLVMYAWEQAGVDLPHYTVAQYDDTTRITESELQPGDLVFYDTGDGADPGHVTMYIGGGRVVTADQPGTDVRIESLTWDGIPMGFGRVR